MLTFHHPRRAGAALLAGLAALAAATGASASATERTLVVASGTAVTRAVPVETADLNLASIAGRDRLAQRIDHASRQACGVGQGSLLDGTRDARACLAEARGNAWAQVEGQRRGARASAGMP